eukprot:Selendium_serpulae@DN5116_c0_g1_i10.p1
MIVLDPLKAKGPKTEPNEMEDDTAQANIGIEDFKVQEKFSVIYEDVDFTAEFVKRMVQQKLDWSVLVAAAASIGEATLPESFSSGDLDDENFLRAVHDVILGVHVQEAKLVCPKCSREYPVSNGNHKH